MMREYACEHSALSYCGDEGCGGGMERDGAVGDECESMAAFELICCQEQLLLRQVMSVLA